jgi:Putative zinc-finger
MNRSHTMDCVDFKVLLSPYIDGEVASEARFAADRHLIECRDCRNLLERAEANDETIRELCGRDPAFASHVAGPAGLPATFEGAVIARINRRQTVQWRRMRTSLGLLATAAAVALGAALWTIGPWGRGDRSASGDRRERVEYGNGAGGESGANGAGWEPLAQGLHGPPMRILDRNERLSPPILSSDESQALRNTALLLEDVLTTPFENIATRTQLREMAVYDELLRRLGEIQPRLDSTSRRHVAAARAAIFELQREHLDVAAWNSLQDDLRSLQIQRELDGIAAAADARMSA